MAPADDCTNKSQQSGQSNSTVLPGNKELDSVRNRATSLGAESTDSGYNSALSSLNPTKSESDDGRMLTTEINDKFAELVQEKLKDCDEGQMIKGDSFVAAVLNEIGGNLNIPRSNIHLGVPPRALKGKQIVFMRKSPLALSSGPDLPQEKTPLTVTVECGPSGLKFQRKVRLTIPHCASTGNWKFSAHQGDTDNDGSEYWDPIPVENVHVNNQNGTVTVEIDHFTLQSVSGSVQEVGESNEANNSEQEEDQETDEDARGDFKWMKALVFLRPVDGSSNQYLVQVQICNHEDAQVSLHVLVKLCCCVTCL